MKLVGEVKISPLPHPHHWMDRIWDGIWDDSQGMDPRTDSTEGREEEHSHVTEPPETPWHIPLPLLPVAPSFVQCGDAVARLPPLPEGSLWLHCYHPAAFPIRPSSVSPDFLGPLSAE